MVVTLEDIAGRVGVTSVTVSNALRNTGRVGETTRQRVLEAAADLGYRPNYAARATARGSFGSAGLILSADKRGRSYMPPDLLRGLADALESRGMHLSIATLSDEQLTSDQYMPKLLRELTCDGLLVNYNKQIPPAMEMLIDHYRLPAVWINAKRDHDAVFPDDFGGAAQATEKLIARGHRRVMYVSLSYVPETVHYSEIDRRDGYGHAMRHAGLEPVTVDRFHPAIKGLRFGQKAIGLSQLLSGADRPTAVVTYALPEQIEWAADRNGLRVPEDLSLISFAVEPDRPGANVTAMTLPEVRIGRIAVEMLLERMASPERRLPPKAVPMGFDPGRTIAPPPGT